LIWVLWMKKKKTQRPSRIRDHESGISICKDKLKSDEQHEETRHRQVEPVQSKRSKNGKRKRSACADDLGCADNGGDGRSLSKASVPEHPKKKKKKKRSFTDAFNAKESDRTACPVESQKHTKPLRETFPFPSDPADHCETPLQAYQDLVPLLTRLAQRLGKKHDQLLIYDPYFCGGRVKDHLQTLGFPQEENNCRDFYADVDQGDVPEFDVLITNPPYTSSAPARARPSIFFGATDHVERLLRYCDKCKKPCALLLPVHYYMKPYFKTCTANQYLAFLDPSERYTYDAPHSSSSNLAGPSVLDAHGASRNKKTRKTSPFVSFWYLLSPWVQGQGAWWHTSPQTWSQPVIGTGDIDSRIYTRKTLPHRLRASNDPFREKKKDGGPKVSKDGKPLCKQCGQVHGLCKHTRS